ncbi:MAG: type II toxin-antitoxin system VapC family toxin [Candidatus Binatia bacterium]
MNYFDTSALIKRFVDEPGSERVGALIAAEPILATSRVAYAEMHAGLARKLRERAIGAADSRKAARLFDTEWPAYGRLDLPDALLTRARDLVRRHPLRGFDAIHLASALHLRAAVGEDVRMIAADDRLLAAADAEGLESVDVRG